MADNPPQNREQRRAAKYGRHRTDVRDPHDPWPTSEPNPALADNPVEERSDAGQTGVTDAEAGGTDEQPDGKKPRRATKATATKPKA